MTKEFKTAASWNKMVGVRLEPKMRYLAELGAGAKEFDTLTDYIKWALEESFKKVTLRRTESVYDAERNPVSLDPEEERIADEIKSIANLSNLLWSDSEFVRIETLLRVAEHRVSDENKTLIQYIHTRKDLRIDIEETHRLYVKNGYQLNREKIDAEWESIKAAFAKSKGGKVK